MLLGGAAAAGRMGGCEEEAEACTEADPTRAALFPADGLLYMAL